MNVNRTTLSLVAGAAGLAAVFGVATAATPPPPAAPRPLPASAERQPVQRTTLMCPEPAGSDFDASTYAAYTPPALYPGGPTGGTAQLDNVPQGDGIHATDTPPAHDKPLVPLKSPGTPASAAAGRTTYPVTGSADGALAPGWTAQMTTVIDAGNGVGLLGTSCQQAGTDLWIPGASTSSDRQDFLHLTNPDRQAAAVDVSFYGAKGEISAAGADNLTIPGNSSVDLLLSVLLHGSDRDITAHVSARSGRIAAEVQAMAKPNGSDWIPPAAQPADTAVLPGIPKDATAVRLIGYGTAGNDADVKVQLLTPSGAIVPAGHETVTFTSGVTTAVDLPKLTQGQIGSLVLTPSDPGRAQPFVAALEITRGDHSSQDIAFLPATAPVGARATVADNRTSGGSTLGLTAPTGDATVRITCSKPTKSGKETVTTVTVKKGTTLQVTPKPSGSGTYAITLVPVSGAPVYASRELSLPADGIKAYTLQPMPDAGGYVAVPQARRDLTVATG